MLWVFIGLGIILLLGLIAAITAHRIDDEDPPEPGSLESEIR